MRICVTPVVEVIVDGTLDEQLLPRLSDQLQEALELNPSLLRLDLAGCPDIADCSWSVLLTTQREAQRQGTDFVLRGCTRPVRRRLRATRLASAFTLEPVSGADSRP